MRIRQLTASPELQADTNPFSRTPTMADALLAQVQELFEGQIVSPPTISPQAAN